MWSMADLPTVRAQFSSVAASKAARKRPTTPSLRGTRPPDLDRRDDIEWFVRDDAPALAALAPEWQRLANASPEQSIFTSPQWALTWWAHFGRGRRLHLIGARRAGELVALAPLCTKRRWGVRIREFLGSEETDLGSFLAMPGEDALTGRLVDIVLEDDDRPCQRVVSRPALGRYAYRQPSTTRCSRVLASSRRTGPWLKTSGPAQAERIRSLRIQCLLYVYGRTSGFQRPMSEVSFHCFEVGSSAFSTS